MENFTKKFHGMDVKLNILTNLIYYTYRTTQAMEGKYKYESKSGTKKARTYIERQNLLQPLSSSNYDQATDVSENTSIDTYGVDDKEEENEDNNISIPDVSLLRRQIQGLYQGGYSKRSTEGANG